MQTDTRIFKVDEITGTHISTPPSYAILRCGKIFHTSGSIHAFEIHMEREQNTPNADKKKRIENKILIGSSDVTNDVKRYLETVFVRKNNVLARELLITASGTFFRNLSPLDLDRWEAANVEFLKNEFPGIVYAVAHKDEQVEHIHAIMVPSAWNENFHKITLQHYRYFGGPKDKDKLIELQDRYAQHMQKYFPSLQRGVHGSRAFHHDIKRYYANINKPLDETDIDSIKDKARNAEILAEKIRTMESIVQTLRDELGKTAEEKQTLDTKFNDALREAWILRKDKDVYERAINDLEAIYDLPHKAVKNLLESNYFESIDKEIKLDQGDYIPRRSI